MPEFVASKCPPVSEHDAFTWGYLEAAEFTECHGDNNPELRDADGFSREFLMLADSECAEFQRENATLLSAAEELGETAEQAGRDFWLTRNGHGAGFWDRGLGVIGDRLTKAAHAYGEVALYVNDDNLIDGE